MTICARSAPPPLAAGTAPSPGERRRARARRRGALLIGAGLALVPWMFVLGFGLPSGMTAAHWSTAWVGFDTLEALGLITTGILLRRRDARRCLAAAVTATLLAVDAWFDVSTAAAGADRIIALGMAFFLEIPLATFCAVLAVRTFPRAARPVDGRRAADASAPREDESVLSPDGPPAP